MTKITIDVPEDILDSLTQDGHDEQIISQRFTSILKLGLTANTLAPETYRYVLNFLVSNPTPQQVLDFRPTASMQRRLGDLVGKSSNGQITESEQQELDEYEQIEHLIILLKTGSLQCISA